jgi:hypothetical protein
MARIITKELAVKIVAKLQANSITSRNSAHDEYQVEENGVVLGIISVRRGSNKEQGHDYIPRELHISPRQARDLAQCPWSREDYIDCMREKGQLPPEEEEEGDEESPVS